MFSHYFRFVQNNYVSKRIYYDLCKIIKITIYTNVLISFLLLKKNIKKSYREKSDYIKIYLHAIVKSIWLYLVH
ncbi:hypothetical protein PUN28_002996 [Cardiocondyla obscurior]|uniref:Uncharacterized protein n=1 Tax=Cardiocondyla obscurior TaxID=286306 RepID=A0AAW2GWZ6_9HYME